ncbi:hypothetical protein GC722_06525 [Auraticoccus sp. F435]|uniref:Uncharacterized protein n=1 Tax=Auraticoccus cholistanensis TaxID=2656650 RepID=A0A6A9V0N1_9ACTN|nr:hypothetical protein [Auraticoccus cholistanensis]MVA75680.1 hypothetical protein [Auraticoccus cholistanensis]
MSSITVATHPWARNPVTGRPTGRRQRPQARVRPTGVRPTGVRPPELAAPAPVVRACRVQPPAPSVVAPAPVAAPQWRLTPRGAAALLGSTASLLVLAVVVMISRFLAVTG